MKRTKLHRRTLLRGALGGLSVAIALPSLEAMFDRRHAFGQAERIRRLGLWFWGNGNKNDSRWVPAATGANWTSPALAPLSSSPIKNYVNIVTGMDVKAGNERGHHSGWAALLSGAAILPQDNPNSNYKSTFRQPSIDQVLAKELEPPTAFRTLELGISNKVAQGEGTTTTYMSHNGPDSPNPAEYDAGKVFDRVFAGVTGGEEPPPITDATTALRKSVLDAVMTDIGRLQTRVGARDRQRLDQHLTNIRAIEQRIGQVGTPPPTACGTQERPAAVGDSRNQENVKLRNELMSDLLAVTLACDLTRIFSVHFSGSFGYTNYWQADPTIATGHHDLTHNEGGDQPLVQKCTVFIMEQLNYLLLKLKDTQDADGLSILDNVAILASSDVSDGKTHSIKNYPIVVAGGGSGYLKNPGVHYKSAAENTSNVLLTVMRAAGSQAASVGAEKGLSSTPCTAIEADPPA